MTDLSAIRAWFADPAASNDEACDHIAALLTEIDRLTAERTALLAPVEGVDLDMVLEAAADRADAQSRHIPTHVHAATSALADSAGPLAREVARLRACFAAAERERDAETRRHECAVTRLSAVRTSLLDETGSAPSITDPPDVWSRETRAAVCGAKCLADEAEELRRSEAALLCRPEGGDDLGFKVVAGLWWKPLDNGCIEIEDFSRCAHPGSDTFRRAHYHNGEVLAYSFHATPRAAMRAPLT